MGWRHDIVGRESGVIGRTPSPVRSITRLALAGNEGEEFMDGAGNAWRYVAPNPNPELPRQNGKMGSNGATARAG